MKTLEELKVENYKCLYSFTVVVTGGTLVSKAMKQRPYIFFVMQRLSFVVLQLYKEIQSRRFKAILIAQNTWEIENYWIREVLGSHCCPRRVLAQIPHAGFWPRGQNPRRHPRIPRAYTYKDKEHFVENVSNCPRRVLAQRPKPEEGPEGPPRVRVYIQKEYQESIKEMYW